MKLMRKYIQYGILLIALMFLHVGMSLCVSDDSVFKEILNNKTIKEHVVWLYMESNGKIFPDTMAAIFTYINPGSGNV